MIISVVIGGFSGKELKWLGRVTVRLHCPMTTLQINSWVARDVVIKIQSKIRHTFEEIVIVMIACVTIRCLLSTYKDWLIDLTTNCKLSVLYYVTAFRRRERVFNHGSIKINRHNKEGTTRPVVFIGDGRRKGKHTSDNVMAKKTNCITVNYETKCKQNTRKIKLRQVREGNWLCRMTSAGGDKA